MTYIYHYSATTQPGDKPLISGYFSMSEPLTDEDKADLKERVAAQFGVDLLLLKLEIQLMRMEPT